MAAVGTAIDAYTPEYVQHNLPFVVLSGLSTPEEQDAPPPVQDVLPGAAAPTISSELPPVTGETAAQLLHEFQNAEGSKLPWHGRELHRRGNLVGFRLRAVGRDFTFPPKKADPPPQSATTPPSSPTIAPSWVLHSPISPLSPASTIFPDGLLAPAWLAKHQDYVPSAFISFFNLVSDPTRNIIHDNQLKNEILNIKGQLQSSQYRTRFAAVLLADDSILRDPDIEDRLGNIRRATGLDSGKSLFFLPPAPTPGDLRALVANVLGSLQPVCVEYYRELTKHARRKKARGSIPPPTAPPTRGAFHPLSQAGWNVRYDFKLAVFAEFRQEMDAAQRHYQAALESLFGSDGIFETTASWSPRWDEIRLLADAIALRLIRCQLWNIYPTSAVQSWVQYKNKMRDLLDRRGKGSSNYGWEAWESRWADIMGHLIQKAELPVFAIRKPISDADPLVNGIANVFSPPEKHFPIGERLSPWELIHHPGYWYKIAADHAKRRLILARDIPEEDRTPPGMSPATKVSSRNQTYDSYLVPEPHLEVPLPGTAGGFEHWKDIIAKLNKAVLEFEMRGQLRKVEQLQLDMSRTLLHAKRYEDAFSILRPLWETMTWRREGWWDIASEVLWMLHECALRVQDRETYVSTEWELYSPAFAAKSRYRHDLMKCLDVFSTNEDTDTKPSISINTKDFTSCLSVTFTFLKAEGNVGEPMRAQIALTSTARPGSAPITLSTLMFRFNGCLNDVQISHDGSDPTSEVGAVFSELALEETVTAPQKPRWSGTSNLTIQPGQRKVFEFPIIFREAGDTNAATSIFEISTDKFDLKCSHDLTTDSEEIQRPTWWLNAGSRLKSRKMNTESGTHVKVDPKPPKMEIRLPNLDEQYYTDETVTLAIEVENQEDEGTEAVLEVRLLGRAKDTMAFNWLDRDSSPMKEVPPSLEESTDVGDLPGHVVGRLGQGEKITEKIRFTAPADPSDYVLEVKVLYHLLSDRDIPISKIESRDIFFNSPFEANYDMLPEIHPDPWPSYFEFKEPHDEEGAPVASGISQTWLLKAKIASFAQDDIIVKDVTVDQLAVQGGAICSVTKAPTEREGKGGAQQPDVAENEPTTFHFQSMQTRAFHVTTQKLDISDRRPTGLDLALKITWQRSSTGASVSPRPANADGYVVSTLPIPAVSLPTSEPRVLCSARPSRTHPGVIHLDYVLENPTMHFLTWELGMEASEEFGFSGPKSKRVSLVPVSRQRVRFRLFGVAGVAAGAEDGGGEAKKGAGGKGYWVYPVLKVQDRYFNQVLKVQGCGGARGERGDGKKVGVWVPVG